MRRTFSTLLIVACGVLVSATTACRPGEPAESAVERTAALSFASAVAALEVLDQLHADRLAAIQEPTEEQLNWYSSQRARLHRLRDALAIARAWLAGNVAEKDGRAAFRAAAEAMQLVVDEMRSQGVKVPQAVDAGLVAAKLFL